MIFNGGVMEKETKEQRIIREHYGLKRRVTTVEVSTEIANLKRRHERGTLDDRDLYLAARLRLI